MTTEKTNDYYYKITHMQLDDDMAVLLSSDMEEAKFRRFCYYLECRFWDEIIEGATLLPFDIEDIGTEIFDLHAIEELDNGIINIELVSNFEDNCSLDFKMLKDQFYRDGLDEMLVNIAQEIIQDNPGKFELKC